MAMHHIHLRESGLSGTVGMSVEYRFDGQAFTINWKDQTGSCPASVGDLVFVDCWGGFPHFGKTVAPKRLDRLALWLVGVPRDMRFAEREEAVYAYEYSSGMHHLDEWESNNWPREFRVIDGPKWFVGMDRLKTDWRWGFVSGWVSPDITVKESKEMVAEVGSRWGPEVVEKFLALADA